MSVRASTLPRPMTSRRVGVRATSLTMVAKKHNRGESPRHNQGMHWIRDEKRARIYQRNTHNGKVFCTWCGATNRRWSLDHIITEDQWLLSEDPQVQFGVPYLHHETNLVVSCCSCNGKRGTMDVEDWIEKLCGGVGEEWTRIYNRMADILATPLGKPVCLTAFYPRGINKRYPKAFARRRQW